ncbi:hypothetical protein [Streptomyces anulatus]|uniref:hypothetical protein n=1 Tax=Streptomyces anulatus TaxID=1892 RepID=UPI00386A1ED3|nr:hypothetical protein OG865_28010 [Streptomyces anulatus]
MSGIDWGDAPTWIAGAFAAIAAFYARSTLKSQQNQIGEQRDFIAEQSANLQLERQALSADLEDRRSSQARQVRLKHIAHGAELNMDSGQMEGASQWFLTVVNGSDAPLHDLSVFFKDLPAAWVQSPGREGAQPLRILARAMEAEFQSPVFEPTDLSGARGVVTFKDDQGVSWRLRADEQLEEVTDPEPGA